MPRRQLIFITKEEYAGLAGHISQNLGALLTEHYLDEAVAAEIFYSGILEKSPLIPWQSHSGDS